MKQVFHAQTYHLEDIFYLLMKKLLKILKKVGATGFEPVTNNSGGCRVRYYAPKGQSYTGLRHAPMI